MATTMGIRNQLVYAKYEHIAAAEGDGMSFCGWGVRNRGSDLTQGNTYLCTTWGADPGTTIEWIRFQTGTGAMPGNGDITITFWQQNALGGNFTNRGTVTFTEADTDAGTWAANTVYTFQLDTPISFGTYAASNCFVSVYTSGAADVLQLSSSTTVAANTNWVAGDISEQASYDWDSEPQVATAIALEAFSSPTSYTTMTGGGSMTEETTDWQNGTACTASGGGAGSWTTGVAPDDPSGIYTGGANAFSAGGNGSEIIIDLHNGAAYTIYPGSGYPGSAYAVYPLAYLEMTYTLNNPGGTSALSVQYNDDDAAVAPAGGWEELWRDGDAVGATTETIAIPVVARWLKIEQIGTNVLDQVSDFNVYVFEVEVTDGKFYVDANDAIHYVWLDEYPDEDKLYHFQLKNKAGSGSDWSDPISNRRAKD